MSELRIATYNAEWMIYIFGGLWKEWKSPDIPATFPGKWLRRVWLEPIEDVSALCERIVGIQEGQPLREQLEVFVSAVFAYGCFRKLFPLAGHIGRALGA